MSRKIVKAGLFFLAVLLMSAPAWSSTSTDFNPAVSSTSLTAETGTGFILAKGESIGYGGPGDCDNPHDGPPGEAGGNGPNDDPGGPGDNNPDKGESTQDQTRDQNQGDDDDGGDPPG